MNTENFDKLLLKTAFSCMASDGDINLKEISTIKKLANESNHFPKEFNIDSEFSLLIDSFNKDNKLFIRQFLEELSGSNFSKDQELDIIDFAVKTINADDKVEYSEIKFFETIRLRLKVSDAEILEKYPDLEFYLVTDTDMGLDLSSLTDSYLDSFEIHKIDSGLFN